MGLREKVLGDSSDDMRYGREWMNQAEGEAGAPRGRNKSKGLLTVGWLPGA